MATGLGKLVKFQEFLCSTMYMQHLNRDYRITVADLLLCYDHMVQVEHNRIQFPFGGNKCPKGNELPTPMW
jgi:hypothetical protein